MSEDLNLWGGTGRLTRDAELKYTSGGIPVCKFSIAVNKRRKIDAEWVLYASFFDCVLWGPLGESLNRYLVKGKFVALKGELHQNRWEQDGVNRSKIEIMVENIHLLPGGKPQQDGGRDQRNGDVRHDEYDNGYQHGPQDVEGDVHF